MAASSTYVPIATQTLGSAAQTVTFSSIPSTYTDLILVIQFIEGSTATIANGCLRFNTDGYATNTNYSSTKMTGNGTSVTSTRTTGVDGLYWDFDTTTTTTTIRFSIHNYANTNVNKSVLFRQDNASQGAQCSVALWRNTAAINQIVVVGSDQAPVSGISDSFSIGSTFTLYGIASA